MFSTIFSEGDKILDFLFVSLAEENTLKEKNLLIEKQILFFRTLHLVRRKAKMKVAELQLMSLTVVRKCTFSDQLKRINF